MKKKLLIITITILVLLTGTVLFFFYSPDQIKQYLPYFNQLNQNTSLVVRSKNGKAEVVVDGKSMGETPLELTDLTVGAHTVSMTRITDSDTDFYQPISFIVEINNNVETIADLEIGPVGTYSGYILYYTPTPFGKSEAFLTVSSSSVATASVGGEVLGTTPTGLQKIKTGEHTLKVTATGYEDLSIPIVIRDDYNLNVTAYLFPLPTNLTVEETADGE